MGILRTLNAFRARDQGGSVSFSWKKPREQLHRTSAHQREVETTSALFNPRLVGVIGGWPDEMASRRAHCARRWWMPRHSVVDGLPPWFRDLCEGWMNVGSGQLQINKI